MLVVPTTSAEEARKAVRPPFGRRHGYAMTDLCKVVNACDRLVNHERLV